MDGRKLSIDEGMNREILTQVESESIGSINLIFGSREGQRGSEFGFWALGVGQEAVSDLQKA